MNLPHKTNASPLMVVVAFAIVYIVWGSTYFFIQNAEHGFPALMLGAARFIISGSLMLAWCVLKGQRVFVKKDIKDAAVSGTLMLFVGTGAVIWVEQYLPSGIVAIMVSSSPLWFVVLDKPKWVENFRSKATIAGLLTGFAGVVLLFSEKIINAFSLGGNISGLGNLGLIVIGTIAWAAGSLYSKYKTTSVNASVNSGWQMFIAGLAFVPGSILRGELQDFHWYNVPLSAWMSLWYLVIFGSLVGFSAYVWLLQVRSATLVSTHAYVNPVVAVLLGLLFANEKITVLQIAGLLTILASVLMVNLSKYQKKVTPDYKQMANISARDKE